MSSDSSTENNSLADSELHLQGSYGGFCFAGFFPEGLTVDSQLPRGIEFPNGAHSALLLTFDVEGTYGNGVGDMSREIDNYERICARLEQNGIAATFNVVGKMGEECGPSFVRNMLNAGSEVATHGYVHDLNKLHGGDLVFAGHYGREDNLRQVRDGLDVLESIRPGTVSGVRLPYGHFNEYSYQTFVECGLKWASNCGIDDFINPGQGCGSGPFRVRLGEEVYPLVEIPLDTQTFDWPIWIADEDELMVKAVRTYCEKRGIAFDRTPAGACEIWRRRMQDAIEAESVFTFLCHPINLTVLDERWGDPVDEFMLPVIDMLGAASRSGQAWVCTCSEMADFYNSWLKS